MTMRQGGASPDQILLAVGLARLRRARGWTHQQLATESAVNHGTISGIEAATRDATFSTLVKLRDALGATGWDELLRPDLAP